METLSGTGLSLFAHQRLRGCLHQIRRYISVSYLLTPLDRVLTIKFNSLIKFAILLC